jgi:hypothetical protein
MAVGQAAGIRLLRRVAAPRLMEHCTLQCSVEANSARLCSSNVRVCSGSSVFQTALAAMSALPPKGDMLNVPWHVGCLDQGNGVYGCCICMHALGQGNPLRGPCALHWCAL